MSKYTDEIELQIVAEYQSGGSLRQLSKKYGCDPSTVSDICERHGIERRPPGGNRRIKNYQEIASGYVQGQSLAQLATKHQCTAATVAYILKKEGIQARKRGYPIQERGCKHFNWKGGKYVKSDGYISSWMSPDDPLVGMRNSKGHALEHRLVMARYLNRLLRSEETVHHINGNKSDNRIENLQLRIGHHGPHCALKCADCGSRNIHPYRNLAKNKLLTTK